MCVIQSTVAGHSFASVSLELLVIDMKGDGFCFSSKSQGVTLRFDPRSPPVRTAWTCKAGDDSFVAVDVTQNGRIDGAWELLGGLVGPKNGFDYLGFVDGRILGRSGRLRTTDRRIDRADPVYATLILWRDANHNGLSEEIELQSVAYAGVVSLSAESQQVTDVDRSGNVITRKGVAIVRQGDRDIERSTATVKLVRD